MDDKTFAALQALAAKLGTTAEYLWALLIKGLPVEGAVHLFFSTLLIAPLIAGTTYGFMRFGKDIKSNDYHTADGALSWMFLVGPCVFFLFVVCLSTDIPGAVTKIVAPEYAALKYILGAVR